MGRTLLSAARLGVIAGALASVLAPLAAAALGRAGYSELASELDALPSGGMEMRADDFLRIMEELRTGILAVLEQDRPDVALPVGSS